VKGKTLLTVFILIAVATVGYRWLPPYYNPFIPLTLDDPPGRITQYKLRRLTPEACASLLAQANQRDLIRTQPVADSGGECPLSNVVRVRDFGPVGLNGSFLASCPLALSSALFISQQARPLTKRYTGSDLRVSITSAALPAAIFTTALTRAAVSMPRRRRWISPLFVWRTATASRC
jgi:hypothetical protein